MLRHALQGVEPRSADKYSVRLGEHDTGESLTQGPKLFHNTGFPKLTEARPAGPPSFPGRYLTSSKEAPCQVFGDCSSRCLWVRR